MNNYQPTPEYINVVIEAIFFNFVTKQLLKYYLEPHISVHIEYKSIVFERTHLINWVMLWTITNQHPNTLMLSLRQYFSTLWPNNYSNTTSSHIFPSFPLHVIRLYISFSIPMCSSTCLELGPQIPTNAYFSPADLYSMWTEQWSGRFLGIIISRDPSVCKSNRLHVEILRFSFIEWGYIL